MNVRLIKTLLVAIHCLNALAQPPIVGFPQFPHDHQLLEHVQEAASLWAQFKMNHLKNFSPEEDQLRFNIFKDNLRRIDELRQRIQNGEIHFNVGVTQFADLTKEEFINRHLKLKLPERRLKREAPGGNRTRRQVAAFIDWRAQGAVTAIKHQGNCASCWAFSAVGSIESQYYLKHGVLVSISEQNLIDCAVDQTNNGCNGGWMANAFQYLTTHSITAESEYPYAGIQQSCTFGTARQFQVSIAGYQLLQADELSLQQAVATIGPISVAIDGSNLQFYAGGVFRDDDCIPGRVNHGVLVVGYGIEAGREFWLVKNSWGSSFGENGYFKMIRNRANQCNIASYGMYPIM
ncbi:procathepsin L [Dendroctonus ponderosae]|uniref:Uncharacterized protein n=1 Tax=Dendroctonus ponderosae TaxID=77166 RepID=A0AAR5Q619_DENPD|nr:procathepsin L [Dendroctonus ponderosae]KAH1022762.1 hypothetical protein HUJ04_012109 [Dendroctonus ponderosae]KAH1029245.1 hypothetical protein HUJ05_002517 [Dendroctonus ponderosae]